ncbi:MAG: carbamoyltransferase HypF, partial [Solirubrobacteraceae bacterium]
RYRYPFINCTNCGPRFTIVRGVPYDRPLTTMAGFAMCDACRSEYEDPGDRRFHAQPNACPACGPSVALRDRDGRRLRGAVPDDPILAAARALRDGAIVAVKGLGGYHLACRADGESAVERLRERKHREERPFALMVRSLATAERFAVLGDAERELLRAPGRPIVLAPRRRDAPVAGAVAPRAPELGLMLPYTPLHHLLLSDLGDDVPALVMTSGNVSDEPIAFDDADALARLAPIADLFLTHDRPIETRTDDSVMRAVDLGDSERRPASVRRSRGWVPAALALPGGAPAPLLACGAQLKSTFCVAKGSRAWISHHIGDLANYETLASFTAGIEHFERLFDVRPAVVAHDLHPEYLSAKYARTREDVSAVGVQHHHAHLAACLAEYGVEHPAVGAIFDGSGYGTDGTIWGGEILYGDTATFERAGALLAVRLPGGERAIREPWRMACAWLVACDTGEAGEPPVPPALRALVAERDWAAVARLAHGGVASPATSSAGRLLDAVAAICGVRARVSYEGQAAIELEAACDPHERGAYPVALVPGPDGALVLDPRDGVLAASAEVSAGVATGAVAARFHNGLAAATAEACARVASARGAGDVVLSGGVFQNRVLLAGAAIDLCRRGLRVLVPSLLPVNDGGISYGQAVVA